MVRLADAQPRSVHAAQGNIERADIADARVIGEQRQHVFLVAEHIFDKSLQGAFRPHFDEHPGAHVVQGVQAFDKLHRGRDLAGEQVQHIRNHARPHGIRFAGHVGNHRDDRRL